MRRSAETGGALLDGVDGQCLEDFDELCRFGRMLDEPLEGLGGETPAVFLAQSLLRIRDRGSRLVPLVPNLVQRCYQERRGRRNIVLKARQLGVSTWIAGRMLLKTITQPGTLTVQVAHTQEAAEDIFRIVRRFVEELPEGLRQGALKTSRSSARQIVFPALDSEYRAESAGDPNAGRGATIRNLHCSEVARWPGDAAETLQGLLASLAPDGELVLESTPNGAEGCFYDEWMEAGHTGTVQHFFPWWLEKEYVTVMVAEETLTAEERRLHGVQRLTLGQIGFRRQIKASFRGLAAQEYAEDAETCFLASGSCIFDVAALDARLKSVRDPEATRLGGALLVWYPPVKGRSYLVVVDPAGGGSEGDYSAVQVLDEATGRQCAELQARIGGMELAEEVARLAREYNGAVVAVERNNHGAGLIAYLEMGCKDVRLWAQDGVAGWLTTSVSRPRMLAELGRAVAEETGLFQSRRLLGECRSFVRMGSGRTEARAGAHDDCVLSMAIGLAVRAGGKARE